MTNQKNHNPLNVALLIEVLSISTYSYQEENAQLYVMGWLDAAGIPYTVDKLGNIYATKSDERSQELPYPCLVSHLDTVHQVNPRKQVVYRKRSKRRELEAIDSKTKKLIGIGGDDLVGVTLCLEALTRLPRCKAAFFICEERGCIGSGQADMRFFTDCSLVLQADRRGNRDITESIMGDEVNSTEFQDALTPLMERYQREWVDGGMTDVWQLKTNGDTQRNSKGLGVCCANLSCGYYRPHSPDEYVVIRDVEQTLWFMLDICLDLGEVAWPHHYVDRYQYRYQRNSYSGRSTGGSRYSRNAEDMDVAWELWWNEKHHYTFEGKHIQTGTYSSKHDQATLNYFNEVLLIRPDDPKLTAADWVNVIKYFEFDRTEGWIPRRIQKPTNLGWDEGSGGYYHDNGDGTMTRTFKNGATGEWDDELLDTNGNLIDTQPEAAPHLHPTGTCPHCGGWELRWDEYSSEWFCMDCNDYHDNNEIKELMAKPLGKPIRL